MSKRILLTSLLITFLGLFIYSIISTGIFYSNSLKYAEKNLAVYMNMYDKDTYSLNEEGAKSFSQKLGGTRVTFLDEEGKIIFDTAGDEKEGDRLNRPEVIQAKEQGQGYDVRSSATIEKDLMYYCVAYDGFYVRIAQETHSLWSIYLSAIPTLVIFIFADGFCCFLFTFVATKSILHPVEEMTRVAATESKEIKAPYPELEPIATIINDMNKSITEKANKIDAESRTQSLILDNMDHGMIVFSQGNHVKLINRQASKLLKYDEDNEEIPAFSEDKEIYTLLKEKQTSIVFRSLGERYYAFRFNPIKNGMLLLITDFTEIKEAERSKDDFIANVTHEMNTPLTSIRGFAELISLDNLPKENVKHAAEKIMEGSDRLSRLITSIINLSAISEDTLIDYELDVTALTKEVIKNFHSQMKEKNIQLQCDLQENVIIKTRKERFVEILNNLISNAIRYNKENGSIKVTLNLKYISVEDTGIGIAKEDQSKIFSRFYTVDKSHSGQYGGFGLGLAIVRKLCRMACWKLTVESELGKGTKFKIEF